MTLVKTMPVFWTKELQETIDFYEQVLTFSCEAREDSWSILTRDGHNIMMALPTDHVAFDGPVFTGSMYLYTDGIAREWEHVRHLAKVCYPLEAFDYGLLEFAIFDNNGYMIQFGQEV